MNLDDNNVRVNRYFSISIDVFSTRELSLLGRYICRNSGCVTFTFLSFITIFLRLLQSPCMPITQLLHCHFSRPVTISEYLFSWLFFLSSPWKFDRYLRLSWKIINSMKVKGRTPLALTPPSSFYYSMHEKHAQTRMKFSPYHATLQFTRSKSIKIAGTMILVFFFFSFFFSFYFDRYNQKLYLTI